MSFIIANDWLFIPLFTLCVFFVAYLASDRVLAFLYRKSLGNREEVMEFMDLMFMETNKKKVTLLMLLGSFGVGAVVFLALWPNVVLGFLLGAALTIMGWSLPKTIISNLWEARCNKVVDQMVDGMVIMANGVKSGLSITQSMERVTENIRGPLAQEFNLVLNKIRLGMALEDALNEFGTRIPRPDVQMFVTSVNILKETGGNLGETFQTITTTIRERQKVQKKIEAMTSQGLMQGIIITIVPFALILVFFAIDPNYIKPLFTKPLGWVALLLMLALQVIGGVSMKKIVTIKV